MTTLVERGQMPHVLLVEDNHGDATLTRLAFKRSGLQGSITVAETGEDGLSILRREGDHAGARHPDLILLDLNLPHMHGLTCLRQIKGDPQTVGIPVIVLTSSCAEAEVKASYAGQASGFITKPFSLEDYEDVVSNIAAYWFKLVQTPALGDTNDNMPVPRSATSGG